MYIPGGAHLFQGLYASGESLPASHKNQSDRTLVGYDPRGDLPPYVLERPFMRGVEKDGGLR